MPNADKGNTEAGEPSKPDPDRAPEVDTSDVDELLDGIDEVLKENAEEFVRNYVQKGGNGGGYFYALAEHINDMFGRDALIALRDSVGDVLSRPQSRPGAAILDAVQLRAGPDIAEYLDTEIPAEYEVAQLLDNPSELRQAIQEVLGSEHEPPPTAHLAPRTVSESEIREQLQRSPFDSSLREHLRELLLHSTTNDEGRLRREFAFVLDDAIRRQLEADDGRLDWLHGTWLSLSATNLTARKAGPIEIVDVLDSREPQSPTTREPVHPNSTSSPERPDRSINRRSAQASGAALEQSFLILLKRAFQIEEDDQRRILESARRQTAGTQFGHDVSFECSVSPSATVRCHVECKNLTQNINTHHVMTKVETTASYWKSIDLDYLIFVSPHSDPTNELERLVKEWNATAKYSFDVKIWSPSTGIKTFFALEPAVYEAIYGRLPEQSTGEAEMAVGRWLDRLRPVLRLPNSVANYLTSKSLQCFATEDSIHYRQLLHDHVNPLVADERGHPIGGTLLGYVLNWIDGDSEEPLLILGEFGDGKSFFTYMLSLHLAEQFLRTPSVSYLTVRLQLSELKRAGNARELLHRRLVDIGIRPEEWYETRGAYQTLLVLDGIDEISTKLDYRSIQQNIALLSECYDTFSQSRLIFTSRTHLLEDSRQRAHLHDVIGNPTTVRLAPVARSNTITHLSTYAQTVGSANKLAALRTLYDPIGVAAKPLFLQMIKVTLPDLPDDRFDELILYRTYVEKSLEWQISGLRNSDRPIRDEQIIARLGEVLEEVAVELYLSGEHSIDLREFESHGSLPEQLWDMSHAASSDAEASDARARVGIRSLLKPIHTDDERWLVDFAHRSMREYFVALSLVRGLRDGKVTKVLSDLPLQPEILYFATLCMKDDSHNFTPRLLSNIGAHVVEIDLGCQGGNCLSLLYALLGELPRSSWSSLNLDHAYLANADLSGMSFAESSLRSATLDNTDLRDADFTNADLSGVRIEETSDVLAICADASGVGIYALYSDGLVRRWRITAGRRSVVDNVLALQPTDVASISMGRHGDLVVFSPFRLQIFSVVGDEWTCVSDFRVSRDVTDVRCVGDDIVVMVDEGKSDGDMVYRYLPKSRQYVERLRVGWRGPLDYTSNAYILPTGRREAQLLRRVESGRYAATALPVSDVATAALAEVENGDLLILVGNMKGLFSVWRWAAGDSDLREMGTVSHSGSGIGASVVAGDYVVTAGGDRAMYMSTVSGGLERVAQFHLKVSCDGLKIDGVKGVEEAAMLSRLLLRDGPSPDGRTEPYP